jgi:hypothetical protein
MVAVYFFVGSMVIGGGLLYWYVVAVGITGRLLPAGVGIVGGSVGMTGTLVGTGVTTTTSGPDRLIKRPTTNPIMTRKIAIATIPASGFDDGRRWLLTGHLNS